jgi:2-phosphosulfolactate phosphatase
MSGERNKYKDIEVDVRIESLLEGAARAVGAVAVIDVFRAFTTAAVALANGAGRVIMVGEVEAALALRAAGVGEVCMGEVHGLKPDGFDFGNSPADLMGVDLAGRTAIQRTSAGTQGIVVAAGRAEFLCAASLVTARATARALAAAAGSGRITLVAMGEEGRARTDEDELCALHLRQLLLGRLGAPEAVRRVILSGGDAAGFRDSTRAYLPAADVEVALDIDRYDFAVRVTVEQGRPVGRIWRP